MDSLQQRLQSQINTRQQQEMLRSLTVPNTNLVDFCSNDYLGLAANLELKKRIEVAFQSVEIRPNGATGSRLISGNSTLVEEVEKELSQIFNAESSILFSSGYAANMALLSAIATKDDTIIYDELAHACIKDGARLSLAKRYSFKHNDINDLKHKLSKSTGQKFVVVESVYSMDGDFCNLNNLLELSIQDESMHLIIDEAHSTGVYGQNGSGWLCAQRLEKHFFARVYTFGKGAGIHGACIAGTNLLMQYLTNFSRPFIYTTAMAPHSLISIRESFRYQSQNAHLQQSLSDNIQFFREQLKAQDWKGFQWIDSQSAIQAIIIPGNKNVKTVAQQIQQKGFEVRPILSPTVKQGEERLRICLHSFNTTKEIEGLLFNLNDILINN